MFRKIWIWLMGILLVVVGVLGYVYVKAKSAGVGELYGAPLYRSNKSKK